MSSQGPSPHINTGAAISWPLVAKLYYVALSIRESGAALYSAVRLAQGRGQCRNHPCFESEKES